MARQKPGKVDRSLSGFRVAFSPKRCHVSLATRQLLDRFGIDGGGKSDYIEDLLCYALWSRHWSLYVSNAQESRDLLTSSPDFVGAIQLVAYRDLRVLLDNPAYRVSLIAAAIADHDAAVKNAVGESYRVVTESWQALYQTTLEIRGLKLRPDVSLTDLTHILTALAEGIGMRMLSDPNARVIDHEHRQSLLGKAALAIAAACIDAGDGKSLEELVAGLSDHPNDLQ